jgi:hypothetical protein
MASIRWLKKEINRLTFEVVSDCFTFMEIHPDKDSKELQKIISDTILLRNEMISRINQGSKKNNPGFSKLAARGIITEFYKGIDQSFVKLSKLSKKNA